MTRAEQLDQISRRLELLRCEIAGVREREQVRREQAGPQKPEDYETRARYLKDFPEPTKQNERQIQ